MTLPQEANRSAPLLQLPSELRQLFSAGESGLLEKVERFLSNAPRRCTYVTSERASARPLQRGWVGKLLRLPTAPPVLRRTESKFGGMPYFDEADLSWRHHRFLGQINFAEIPDPPVGAPVRGVLGIDMADSGSWPFRTRWYPDPTDQAAPSVEPPGCVGAWETRMRFRPGWSLPRGNAWFSVLPKPDEKYWDAWNDWSPEHFDEDEAKNGHRILGHRSGGLDEHYGFRPAEGRSENIEEYEMLWRIDFDNDAGFAWGTNWVYVILHREDLALGRLDRVVVTAANS